MFIPNGTMISGKEFINSNIKFLEREKNIVKECLAGNIPDFLRKFAPITIEERGNSITYMVMPDVLSIGNDDDFVRMPMTPISAKIIADQYDCCMPTKKMSQQIYKNSVTKVTPHPLPYDQSMVSSSAYLQHNEIINKQVNTHQLLSGHKKDVIIDKLLLTNRNVGIYGWFDNGNPIQGLNCTSHDINYVDYSHGIRMIMQDVLLNGLPVRIFDVINSEMYYLLSDFKFDASKIYESNK